MMQLTVDCLRFGELVVRGAAYGAFEIVQLTSGSGGVAVARFEVEDAGFPKLKVTRLEGPARSVDAKAMATIDRAVLASWRDEAPPRYELSASAAGEGVEIVLAGDCRHRMFWWRAQCRLTEGEAIVHGPFLANDPDS